MVSERPASEPGAPVDQRPDRWVRSQVVPAYEDMAGRLRGIRPPDGDATYLAGIYEDLAHRIEILRLTPGGGRDVVRADEDLRRRFASYGMEAAGPCERPRGPRVSCRPARRGRVAWPTVRSGVPRSPCARHRPGRHPVG